MNTMFCDLGTVHQTSCAHTPQQNGIAERKHRHLLNVARSLMLPSSMINGKSPFELVYKKKPNLSYLSPNDEGKDSPVEDGSMKPSIDTADFAQGMYQEGRQFVVHFFDQNWSEGNVHNSDTSLTQIVDSLDDGQTLILRRSNR
ncbi:ribonuclease H-like domain-containing protein [Tanacetum coccineum]